MRFFQPLQPLFILVAATAVAAAPFKITNATIIKRDYENVPFTWYDDSVGYGACGGINQPYEYVRASI